MLPIKERSLDRECIYAAVRSGGPGGQHVNKVATKVELAFDVNRSALLTDEEKQIISTKLAAKINEDGYLKISDSSTRSQADNKVLVLEKLYKTIEQALVKPKVRKATKIPKAVKERIKVSKIKSAEKKANRRPYKGDWY